MDCGFPQLTGNTQKILSKWWCVFSQATEGDYLFGMVTRMVDRSTPRAKLFSQVREIRVALWGRLQFHIPDRSTTGIHFSLSLPHSGSNKSLAGMSLAKDKTEPASLPKLSMLDVRWWCRNLYCYTFKVVILPLLLLIGQSSVFFFFFGYFWVASPFLLLTFLFMQLSHVFCVTVSILSILCSLFTCPVYESYVWYLFLPCVR